MIELEIFVGGKMAANCNRIKKVFFFGGLKSRLVLIKKTTYCSIDNPIVRAIILTGHLILFCTRMLQILLNKKRKTIAKISFFRKANVPSNSHHRTRAQNNLPRIVNQTTLIVKSKMNCFDFSFSIN